MMMKRLHVYALGSVLSLFAVTSSPAQQTQSSEQQLQQLVRDLNTQLQRAEQERLADPWFIRDLQELIKQYDKPWQQQILFDDFSSRGPEPAAPWQVSAGEFLIDWRYGLRSVVSPRRSTNSNEQQSSGKEDIAAVFLGAILEQALEGDDRKETQSQPAKTTTTVATVNAQQRIPNSFSIDVQFSNRDINGTQQGHLVIGTYQIGNARAGYQLHYYRGTRTGEPSLSLNRVSNRGGDSVLDLYAEPINLVDGNAHQLVWTRDLEGRMTISLDGQAVLEVRDRSYRDSFDVLFIENRGGDFAIREIDVHGRP